MNLDHIGHDLLVLHAVLPARTARPAHKHVHVAGILLHKERPGDRELPNSKTLTGSGRSSDWEG